MGIAIAGDTRGTVARTRGPRPTGSRDVLRQWDLLLALLVLAVGSWQVFVGGEGLLRLLPGLTMVVVIPGYAATVVLFPNRSLGSLLRLAYSIGLSMALVAVVVFLVNALAVFINALNVTAAVSVLSAALLVVAFWARWRTHSAPHALHLPLGMVEGILVLVSSRRMVVVLAVLITLAAALFLTNLVPPTQSGRSVFYLLGPPGTPSSFPTKLALNQTAELRWVVQSFEAGATDYQVLVQLSNAPTLNLSLPVSQTTWNSTLSFAAGSTYGSSFSLVPSQNYTQTFTFRVVASGHFYLVFRLSRSVEPDNPIALALDVTV